MTRKLSVHTETWSAAAPFSITGRTVTEFQTFVAGIGQGERRGRGEGMAIHYLGETAESILAQLESARAAIEDGADRQALRSLLPPGAARNTLDAALWDLESRLEGRSAWTLAGVEPRRVETVYTIGIEAEPEAMGEKAARVTHPLLKIKLDGDRPVERVEAIRRRRPDARLVVDANQGWSFEQLRDVAEPMKRLGVIFIEQPLRRGSDDALEGYKAPLPLAADESCQHIGELEQAARRYQMINIKLDKCGGLTEGLLLARAARERGLGLMVGCMGGTSLAMAPAHVLAQLCDYVDIDGPLLLKNDRLGGFVYDAGKVSLPASGFCWGS
jgi:L-alanine-DL-glutamate epimerase-like enolase superfamily enzyme